MEDHPVPKIPHAGYPGIHADVILCHERPLAGPLAYFAATMLHMQASNTIADPKCSLLRGTHYE